MAYGTLERRNADGPIENMVKKVGLIATGREGVVFLVDIVAKDWE